MKQRDVINFFDRCAATWDDHAVTDDAVIGKILDCAGICAGMRVLDVACGTGVLFPYYLARGVESVIGIDISPEMVRVAVEKWGREPRVGILCGDAESWPFETLFDAVVVYNAFPHFPEPERLIRRLTDLLRPGGSFTVAHGASRAVIDAHHQAQAAKVSMGLLPAETLRELFANYLQVETVISDDRMYQVTGTKQ